MKYLIIIIMMLFTTNAYANICEGIGKYTTTISAGLTSGSAVAGLSAKSVLVSGAAGWTKAIVLTGPVGWAIVGATAAGAGAGYAGYKYFCGED